MIKPKFLALISTFFLIWMFFFASCSALPAAIAETPTPHNVIIPKNIPASSSNTPTSLFLPSTTLPPATLAERENEIVAFQIDYFLQNRKDALEIYKTSMPSMVNLLNGPDIIIWEKAKNTKDENPNYSNSQEPIKVWTYIDGKLTEEPEPVHTIQQYSKKYIDVSNTTKEPVWGFHEFSIISISADGTIAELYDGSTCGPTCGAGFLYTLKRNAPGKWEIIDRKFLWVS